MKKLLLTVFIILVMFLAACNSPETKELIDYHNSYVETINKKAMLVDEELLNSYMAESPQVALEMQKDNVLPLVEEIEEFIISRQPETDVVKELHKMRVEQLNTWSEAVLLRYQALEKTVEKGTEEEIDKLILQSDKRLLEAQEMGEKADERFQEMANEFKVELEDE